MQQSWTYYQCCCLTLGIAGRSCKPACHCARPGQAKHTPTQCALRLPQRPCSRSCSVVMLMGSCWSQLLAAITAVAGAGWLMLMRRLPQVGLLIWLVCADAAASTTQSRTLQVPGVSGHLRERAGSACGCYDAPALFICRHRLLLLLPTADIMGH